MCTHTPCWWQHCEAVRHRARRSSVVVVPWAFVFHTGSPCFGVRGVSRSCVVFPTRFICVVHVIVFLHHIIILYCEFSGFVNSIGLLVLCRKRNLWSRFSGSTRVACRVLKMGSCGKLLLALIFTFATKGEFYPVTSDSICVSYVWTIIEFKRESKNNILPCAVSLLPRFLHTQHLNVMLLWSL